MSDTSWTTQADGDFSTASISIEFSDATDFNAVTQADLLGMDYANNGVTTTMDFVYGANFGSVFSKINGEVFLWAGLDLPVLSFVAGGINDGSTSLAVSSHGLNAVVLAEPAGWLVIAQDKQQSNGYQGILTNVPEPSTLVPEPSTLAIFALGMIGLASRRFKKKA